MASWAQMGMQMMGAVVGAVGDREATKTQDRALKYEAAHVVASANAEADQYLRATMGEHAKHRALRLSSGVANEGSVLEVDEATVQEIALSEANIRYGGRLEAHKINTERKMAKQASRIRMMTSLISGGQAAFQGIASSGRFGGAPSGGAAGQLSASGGTSSSGGSGGGGPVGDFDMGGLGSGMGL